MRGRRAVIVGLGLGLAWALAGVPAAASTGASQTVTYAIVETRGISISAPGEGSPDGEVTWSGSASRLSATAEGGAALLTLPDGSVRTLEAGGSLLVPAPGVLHYRPADGEGTTVLFNVSAG